MNDSKNCCRCKVWKKVPAMMIFNGTVFIASACIMIIEIVAGRIVSRYVGQSLYTWTSVIGVVLAGISVGNYFGGRLADRFRPGKTLAVLFFLSSLLCLTIPALNYGAGRWLFLLEREWPVRIFLHVTLTFILPSCALGMISPVVAKMALDQGAGVGRTIGGIYAWGACGSIVGTFLAGFYLIALVGTVNLLVIIAVVLAVMAAAYSGGARFFCLWLVISGVALLGANGNTESARKLGGFMGIRDVLEGNKNCLYRAESQYMHIAVMCPEGRENNRSMILDRLTQCKTDVDHPLQLKYEYFWVYEAVINKHSKTGAPVSAFAIGGGGYVFPQYLEQVRPGSDIHVAEIDPAVTKAAFAAFGLDANTTVKIHNMDARNYVDDLVRMKEQGREVPAFDYILGDSFNHFCVPYHLTTFEFTEKFSRLMKPDGIYMLNMIDMYQPGLFLGATVRTLECVFPYVYVFSATGHLEARETFVVFASKTRMDTNDIDEIVRGAHPKYLGRQLTDAEMDSLRERENGMILTDDFAPVEQLLACVVRDDYEDLFARYVVLGTEALDGKKYDKAIGLFEKMMKRAPALPDPYFNLGEVFLQKGDDEKAWDYFKQALAMDQDSNMAQNRIAELTVKKGDIQGGLALWREILQKDAYNINANNNIGLVLGYNGNLDEAMNHWRRVLSVKPGDVFANYQMGIACMKKGMDNESAMYIRKAKELDPDLAEVKRDFLPVSDSADASSVLRRLF